MIFCINLSHLLNFYVTLKQIGYFKIYSVEFKRHLDEQINTLNNSQKGHCLFDIIIQN